MMTALSHSPSKKGGRNDTTRGRHSHLDETQTGQRGTVADMVHRRDALGYLHRRTKAAEMPIHRGRTHHPTTDHAHPPDLPRAHDRGQSDRRTPQYTDPHDRPLQDDIHGRRKPREHPQPNTARRNSACYQRTPQDRPAEARTKMAQAIREGSRLHSQTPPKEDHPTDQTSLGVARRTRRATPDTDKHWAAG